MLVDSERHFISRDGWEKYDIWGLEGLVHAVKAFDNLLASGQPMT